MNRVHTALADLTVTNLRSNQELSSDFTNLLSQGNIQLQDLFLGILKDNVQPVEPLHYTTKRKSNVSISTRSHWQ